MVLRRPAGAGEAVAPEAPPAVAPPAVAPPAVAPPAVAKAKAKISIGSRCPKQLETMLG